MSVSIISGHWHLYERPHHVYKYLAADGSVLYVGCTHDLNARHRAHSKRAPWFSEAVDRVHQTYSDMWYGRVAERVAIICHRPPHNKTYNYWTPSDAGLCRELSELKLDPPVNAPEVMADLERRVFEQECIDQRARENDFRAQWDLTPTP